LKSYAGYLDGGAGIRLNRSAIASAAMRSASVHRIAASIPGSIPEIPRLCTFAASGIILKKVFR